MPTTRIFWAALFIFAGLCANPAAFAQKREGPDGAKKSDEISGLIKAIDLKIGTLTIVPLRDGGRDDVTFNLADKKLKVVTATGEVFQLTDLTPGMRVVMRLRDQDIIALLLEPPIVPAFLTHIDSVKKIVEARAEKKLNQFEVAKEVKITINGRPTKLSDVPLDERVFLTLSFDKKTILAIHANQVGRGDGIRRGEAERKIPGRDGLVQGAITELAADHSSLNVQIGRGGANSQAITIGKDTKIEVLFMERKVGEATSKQLAKDMAVVIRLAGDQKTAATISVIAPTMQATVKSVDVAGKKITLVSGRAGEKTYDVDAAAVIRLQAREGSTLADVTPGANVTLGLSLDRQRIIGIAGAGRRAEATR